MKLATPIPAAPPLAQKNKNRYGGAGGGVHLRCKRVNLKVAPALVAPLTNGDAPELGWLPNLDTKSCVGIAQIKNMLLPFNDLW